MRFRDRKSSKNSKKPPFAAILLSSRGIFNDKQRAFQHREELLIQRTVLERSNIFSFKKV